MHVSKLNSTDIYIKRIGFAKFLICSKHVKTVFNCNAKTMMLNKTSLYLFLTDIGYENMINTMLKDLFKLLVACVAEPTEIISRVGCSCIR